MTTAEKIDAVMELLGLPDDAVNISIKMDHDRGKVRVGYDLLMDEDNEVCAPLNLTMVAPDPRDRAGNSNSNGVVA
ncbi:hypothetical protein [Megalodesulfovibrio gigas]|uniref:Uncharacterized protein n=1 Tax=Megalodesulfovibrio gigas (strain ATCC 19364 / DSM 1382 / NCIMB 9332 / VKM B-1759) TaxID=1121448 RepID=T2GBY3_MEGG1|nr:hypothetical protein [Megalodesulfovibrio gigas]AGW13818.1 hypothetical protein DGI_2049 [Megalodesulfovibrio gigas DSM 1382 = ATCC 19364]